MTDADQTPARETSGADGESAFWLAFSRVPHIGPARIERLTQRFGSLETAWSAPVAALRAVLDAQPLAALLAARSGADPSRELRRLEMLGIRVCHPGHSMYPWRLAEISGPPPVLYVRGELVAADQEAVAIVGTRRATTYGRQAAELIAAELAGAGVTVISGLARGIDGAAHRAALQAGGRTIAVLGSGPDVIYPAEHARLAEQILASGAIVSELPPGAKPDAANFPARNRIISGMSVGVVIVEAPLRSGALITASFAGDQGRDVFVVPGSIFSQTSAGTNALLRDGARIIRDAADVLEDLNLGSFSRTKATQVALPLDADERALIAVMSSEARHIDELAEEAGLTAAAAGALLLTMELKGFVRNQGAQFYVLR